MRSNKNNELRPFFSPFEAQSHGQISVTQLRDELNDALGSEVHPGGIIASWLDDIYMPCHWHWRFYAGHVAQASYTRQHCRFVREANNDAKDRSMTVAEMDQRADQRETKRREFKDRLQEFLPW